ncbi:uncharacterized protein LOC129602870 [Paramacrobiotus metropolitanus]|uniref:uncharacterized protein LOC129602870 n=1 Tax=Paramacrobiotus metropolitanus TaxID=2943436 RepID=UPI0024459BF9|nr:uncharacterized protein LOC129602870 [Paramacrobiotus metropolitanus]
MTSKKRISICSALIATLLFAQTLGCSPAERRTKQDEEDILLWNAVRGAQTESVDGRIELPQNQSSTPLPDTVRILTGETAVFRCYHYNPHKLLWRHQDNLIKGTAPVVVQDQQYSIQTVDEANYLSIHNVSRFSAGSVECLRPCGDGQRCPVKHFTLRPKLRPADVFIGHMPNVTTLTGVDGTFKCQVNFRCCPSAEDHFIWKVRGGFVYLPEGHLLERVVHLQPGRWLHVHRKQNYLCSESEPAFCEQTLFVWARLRFGPNPSVVECWARADVDSEEWVIQKALLDIIRP